MKSLEINVNDTIEIFDTLAEAINYLTEYVKRWYESEDNEPLSISIRKETGRAPPLKVNVNDGIGSRSGLA